MKIAALLAGLFSGTLGAMGLGGGSVLIIYLSLFTDTKQLTAQGINLLFFIPTAIVAVIIFGIKKQIKWRTNIIITLWGLLGTFSGLLLTSYLGSNITGKIFGGMLIILGVKEIFRKNTKTVAQKNKNCYTENE